MTTYYGNMNFKKEWKPDKKYTFETLAMNVCDAVTYKGNLYVAIADPAIGEAPDKYPDKWVLIGTIGATNLTPLTSEFGFSSEVASGTGVAPKFLNQNSWMESNLNSGILRLYGSFRVTLTKDSKNWMIQLKIPQADVKSIKINLPAINTSVMYVNFTGEQSNLTGGTQPYVQSTSSKAGSGNVINIPQPGGAIAETLDVVVNFEIITTFTTI